MGCHWHPACKCHNLFSAGGNAEISVYLRKLNTGEEICILDLLQFKVLTRVIPYYNYIPPFIRYVKFVVT